MVIQYEINVIPEKKTTTEEIVQYNKILKEIENKIKKFIDINFDDTLKVNLYYSSGQMKSSILSPETPENKFGDFCSEMKGIYIIHPVILKPIFKENTDKKFREILKYTLLKYILTKKYNDDKNSFTLYKKNLINTIASLFSGNYIKEILNREILRADINKKYSSKDLLNCLIYSIIRLNGEDYVKNKLDDFFKEKNVFELSQKFFNKKPIEVILLAKDKLTVLKNKERNLNYL